MHKVKRLVDDLLAKGNELPTKLVISWVLNNLTSDYESFVANTIQTIRLNEASVSLENLFSSLLDESRRLQGLESPSQALVASKRPAKKANATVSQPNAAGKQCNFCKRPGHVEATCWKKYPSKNARHRAKAKPKKANTSITDVSDDEEQQLLSAVVLHTVQIQDWILDSGATTHICCNRDAFTSISSSSTMIQWGAGASIKASSIGSVVIQLPDGSKATLQKVLLVPELKVNLVALSQLIQKGLRVKFSASNAEISLQNGYKIQANLQKGLYFLPFRPVKPVAWNQQVLASATGQLDLQIWHYMIRDGPVSGLKWTGTRPRSWVPARHWPRTRPWEGGGQEPGNGRGVHVA